MVIWKVEDFSGGPVVKNLPADARDTGSIPGPGRFRMLRGSATMPALTLTELTPVSRNYWAHVLQILKPEHLEPVLCSKRSHQNEKPEYHN